MENHFNLSDYYILFTAVTQLSIYTFGTVIQLYTNTVYICEAVSFGVLGLCDLSMIHPPMVEQGTLLR